MKNRTAIGIVCIILAVAVTFVVSPLVNNISDKKTEVVRFTADVSHGTEIKDTDIELVEISNSALPEKVIKDKNAVVGKYATTDIFKGDFATESKVTDNANTASDIMASLKGDKVAISKSSTVTLNSSVGKYTVPVTNQNAVRFKLETWWNSDKTNTHETTWINLPVVQSDVALTSITLINSSTGATLDPNNLKVGTNVKVRYTYKNNTDTKVYVEGFKNDKTQISGVYSIPAKSSITVDGYSFVVPNKRSISIWGGVYLEGIGVK